MNPSPETVDIPGVGPAPIYAGPVYQSFPILDMTPEAMALSIAVLQARVERIEAALGLDNSSGIQQAQKQHKLGAFYL